MSAYPLPAPFRTRRARLLAGCALAAATATPAHAQFQANGVVVGGDAAATIANGANRTDVIVKQGQVVINWTPTDTAISTAPIDILPTGNVLRFDTELDGGTDYIVLNRVIPTDTSRAIQFNGTVESLVSPNSVARQGGAVWFYSPGGIIAGAGSRFDVGSLVLTTNDIDTTGGLFGSNGEIRFRGAADSRSRVQIDVGARIDARAELSSSNYVALIAPRIIQNGVIQADGSVALIAATALDLTIPVNGGLFDIAVTAGTKVNAGGETVLTHGGETYANDLAASGAARQVYMAAVSKNDAVTMLVAGKAGYDSAQGVTFGPGGIQLVAGRDVNILDASEAGTQVVASPGDTVQLGAGSLNRAIAATGGGFELRLANAENLTVMAGLDARADRIDIATSSGSTASVSGNLDLTGLSIDMTVGGAFNVGGTLSATASAIGASALPQTAGSIAITADGGNLASAFGFDLEARAVGNGDTQGGDILLSATNGGFIDTGYGITLDASAQTRDIGAGAAQGGDLLLSADGGIISGGGLFLTVEGEGDGGGTGTGGTIGIKASGSGQILANNSLSAIARGTSGESGYGDTGGAGIGGIITLDASGTAKINAGGGIALSAVGFGDDHSATDQFGGIGEGGRVSLLTADTAQISSGGTLFINAQGFGGESGYGTGGAATGGKVEIKALGGTIAVSDVDIQASAFGGGGESGGGGATGGGIELRLNGASLETGAGLSLSAQAVGGGAGSATGAKGGAGTGGFVTVDGRGNAELVFDQLKVVATGSGGAGRFFFRQNENGGDGRGGTIAITLSDTITAGANEILLDASGDGGSASKDAGSGFGGSASLVAASGSNLTTLNNIELLAQGIGATGDGAAGRGEGGQIAIKADGGTIDASSVSADASGFGDTAFFPGGAGGDGIGGGITLTSRAGGVLRGASDFRADGRAGDGIAGAAAGFGQGGTITVDASGGIIEAGETLRLFAEARGGNSGGILSLAPGATLLARGGAIKIGVEAGGQLLLTDLIASADAGFDDQPDGIIAPNHGGNAVGGTASLSVGGGSVSASFMSFSAEGSGAVSPSEGAGGTGYHGRAEVLVEGGTLNVGTLDVSARAFGGPGYGQDSEAGDEAGAGGDAGVGASPFVGQSGAFVSVSSGSLQSGSVSINASSFGGEGGDGEEFADVSRPREGGAAVGGVASFVANGSGNVQIDLLRVEAQGTGGDGGNLQLFGTTASDAAGGKGGSGTGGLASISLSGSGSLAFAGIQGSADGFGGDGGFVEAGYGRFDGGGRGGDGGDAFGGGINVTVAASLTGTPFVGALAAAQAGDGGNGPRGGSGGNATAGSATIAVASGATFFGGLQAFGDAVGGDGGDGLGGSGGAGGSATGFNANLTIGADAKASTGTLQIFATASGGFGGRGADDLSAAFRGGDGGAASGGKASITLSGGSLTLFDVSEGSSAQIIADAFAGDGGNGGDAVEGTAGSGGNGGRATAGRVFITSDGGAADLFSTRLSANAIGGSGGSAGFGLERIDGSFGDAQGGSVRIAADQSATPGRRVRLGVTELSANSSARFAEGDVGTAGDIEIDATGSDPSGAISFARLDARTNGREPSPSATNGITVRGTGSPIIVDDGVDFRATGSVAFAFAGDSGLRSGADVFINAGGSVTGSHSGRPSGASSVLAGNVLSINADENIGFTGDSLLRAAVDINLDARAGFVTSAGMAAGSEVTVNAARDVDIGSIAASSASLTAGLGEGSGANLRLFGPSTIAGQLNVSASGDIRLDAGADVFAGGNILFSSGDDIIIGAGAILRGSEGPPPEAGYGGPLLLLNAGSGSRGGAPIGDIASLIVDGAIQFAAGTAVLAGDAIAGNPATGLVRAGNFYADLSEIPSNELPPSDDLGQLSGKCLQGSVCLGSVEVSRFIAIGDNDQTPLFVRFNPQVDAVSVFVSGRSVELGQAGVTSSMKASDALQLEATNGGLALLGTIRITGGTNLARITATDSISGAGDVSAPDTLELSAGKDISLGAVQAATIRTIGLDGTVVNASGLTAAGKLDIGKVTYAKDIDLIGGTGVSLGSAELASDTSLNLFTSAGMAQLGGGTAGDVVVTGDSVAISVAASGDVIGTAVNGSATLGTVTVAGDLALQASAALTIGSAESGADLTLQSLGANVSGGDLKAGANLLVAGLTGVELGSARGSTVGITAGFDSAGATSTIADVKVAGLVDGPNGVDIRATGDIVALGAIATLNTATLKAAGQITGGSLSFGSSVIEAVQGISFETVTTEGVAELNAQAGAVIVSKNITADLIRASGTSMSLTGQSGLNVDTVSGGDVTLTALAGELTVGSGDASGAMTLTSGGSVSFASLSADKSLSLNAAGDIRGGSATAASIAITTPGALVADGLIATAGTLSAIATKGLTIDTAASSGTTTLKADQGSLTVVSDLRPGEGLIVSAPSISLTGENGLKIVEANATVGDLILKTVAGDLIAGRSTAAGAISLDSAGALGFTSLTAQQGVTLKAAGDITGDSVAGTSVSAVADGNKGIALQSIAATGPVTLGAAAGGIQVGNVLTSGAIQATARSIGLGSTGNILLTQASATDGDVVLASGGGITLGQVSATKALTAHASAGTLTVTGSAVAGTIGFTSADIAIGTGAQVGSVSQTGSITFTSTAPRTFIGGAGSGTGYRLDAAELTRVAARDDFTVTTPPSQGSEAFSFVDPGAATMVLDSLTFTGAQLGANGIFTVNSPRSIGIVGNVEYKNFAAGQSVIYRAGGDLSLAAETGLVTLKDSAGALAGTLRLEANQIHAVSTKTRSDVAGLTLNEARKRLGTNDQVDNQGGYFQAGSIIVRMNRLLIQNSGANSPDPNARRGLTANNLTIFAGEGASGQVVLNGRVNGATGGDLRSNVTLNGSFDLNSDINGCGIGSGACGAPPPPSGPPAEVTDVTFSVARDQIRDEQEEDEQEEALQAAQTRPEPVIQFMNTPSSRFDPLIDEPITGAGNEDLWEAPPVPSPGN